MSGSENCHLKRLPYNWVAMLAFVLMAAAIWVGLLGAGAGPQYGSLSYAQYMTVLLMTFLILPLAAWLGLIVVIYRRKPTWHGRTLAALLPPAFLFAGAAWGFLARPPSPQRYFERTFHVAMPVDAHDFQVTAPTLADSNLIDFAFTCSSRSTQQLVQSMQLEASTRWPLHYPRVETPLTNHEWKENLFFVRETSDGFCYYLVTDSRMENVIVAQEPIHYDLDDDT